MADNVRDRLRRTRPALPAGVPASCADGTVVAIGPQTVVALHAHPDDEALLTGGTLARLAATGHRVVLVTATAGAAGLAARAPGEGLARQRSAELHASAAALGVARVVELNYADSGWTERSGAAHRFCEVPVAQAAARVAAVLVEEQADILTTYDARGGYGHPDHVRVHDVGQAAAVLAGTPRVLQATVDRTLLSRAVRVLSALHILPAGTPVEEVGAWYSGRAEITHRVPVRDHVEAKRAALRCHASQAVGGTGPRTIALLLRLPRPLFRLVCGTEYFIETGAPVPVTPCRDPLVSALPSTTAVSR